MDKLDCLTIAEELQPYDAEHSAWRAFYRDWEEHEAKESEEEYERRQTERRNHLMATNPQYRELMLRHPEW